MREIRQSGSEGGGELPLSPYPYHWRRQESSRRSNFILRCW